MTAPREPAILINSIDLLADLLREISSFKLVDRSDARFFLDLEGSISIIQLYILQEQPKTYLLDVHVLKEAAFDHSLEGLRWASFRQFLEDPEVVKVFFDVRNDSHEMKRLYGVRMDGIRDLQLMELGSRKGNKRCIKGLAACIKSDIGLTEKQEKEWLACKDAGQRLYVPNLGGAYEVWDERPLNELLLEYCSQDTWCLPELYKQYYERLSDDWLERIDAESRTRVIDSLRDDYDRNGRNRTKGPSAWQKPKD